MFAGRALAVGIVITFLTVSLSGSVGDPTPRGFIRFDDVRREAFSAVAVQRTYGASTEATLVVRIDLMGDGRDESYAKAAEWLLANANVRLVEDPRGAPFFLTNYNLVATSGPGAIGATVRSGMVIETRDPSLTPCVAAHEVLHFLGLHHVEDPRNLMFPKCQRDKLDDATLTDAQLAELRTLRSVTAMTPLGLVTWASR